MPSRLLARWQGVLLTLTGVVATVWLGLTGHLELYIHPRYVVFTVVMAVLAGALVLAWLVLDAARPAAGPADAAAGHDGHDDEADDPATPRRALRALRATGTLALVVAAVVGLLVLPPTTLSSATAQQRTVNAAAGSLASSTTPELVGGDYASFTVKDWASLIRQGEQPDFFAGKKVTLVGFVTPDPSDPKNDFFLTRFVITCCAVDAQPIGVAVYQPGWSAHLSVNEWVQVTGGFATNPSVSSDQAIALVPSDVRPTSQPAQPYEY